MVLKVIQGNFKIGTWQEKDGKSGQYTGSHNPDIDQYSPKVVVHSHWISNPENQHISCESDCIVENQNQVFDNFLCEMLQETNGW